ncbi:MAG: 50S ribosomal protein L23 [Flavobacteriales bacterium]|jgi:large subunit ribosomal protein L23|nr:50S ribosomal protein L23 [Flavobacteriales bacterium]MCB9191479.1 50S ribosomal protein L23 [Flavobacteriales bacterium]MCB9203895.1 50S ribosomal protein L23 [Flavobacteriales bacterium]
MEVLVKPLITEKMTGLSEKKGQYGFVVNRKANKLEVKKAIEDMYGVNVQSVNTMIIPGKKRSRNTKTKFIIGRTSAVKKAIVTLAEGQSIDFYSNI